MSRSVPALVALTLIAALVAAAGCSGGSDQARSTATSSPATGGIAPTAPGILNPPQTSQAGAPPLNRQRAEAFLRRIALQSAELPASLSPQPPVFLDAAAQAKAERNPADAAKKLQDWGLVLAYDSVFRGTTPRAGTLADIRGVRALSLVFQSAEGAHDYFSMVTATVAEDVLTPISTRALNPKAQRESGPAVGEESVVWRATGPSIEVSGAEVVSWMAIARRGPSVTIVTIAGTKALDSMAGPLAQRLDERTAAALAAGLP